MVRRGMSLPPSAGSVFRPAAPATGRRNGRPESVARPWTPRWSAPRRTATFHRFIKHVLHVKSASGAFQMKPPKHPISCDTLPHFVTHYAIPLACVCCVFQTTGDYSPGETGAWRRSFQSWPQRPLRYVPKGCRRSRSRQERREGRGRLDAFESSLLRANGDPLSRPAQLNLRQGRGWRSPCAFITPMQVLIPSCPGRLPAVDWL